MAIEEAPDRTGRKRGAVLVAEQIGEFDQRDVHLGLDRSQDHAAVGLDPMRTQITALRQGRRTTFGAPRSHPADSAGHRDAEALGRGMAGHAAVNGGDHPRTQILGQGSCHPFWPPFQYG
jgi:hypothetical protein